MSELYIGRATPGMYEDFMDFINMVFASDGKNEDFLSLLPKLYKKENAPCESNYVAVENGSLRAAVGAYDRELLVAGVTLRTRGIGNVAVHPDDRGKGYMTELMKRAAADMIADGVDMSDLGGMRHRYGYFSYECASPVYKMNLTELSLKHCLGDVPPRALAFAEVTESGGLLDAVIALYEKKPCRVIRTRESFLDIAHSWRAKLWAILDGERLIGCFINQLEELTLADSGDFEAVVRAYVQQYGRLTIKLPLCEPELLARASRICGKSSLENDQNYTIFNFRRVVGAFMKLKAQLNGLADGYIRLHIRGVAGDERFAIIVKNGALSIVDFDGDADLTLEHRRAVEFFFAICSPERMMYPAAGAWFPLPLYIAHADHV